MKLGLGGIGQGFIADKIKAFLKVWLPNCKRIWGYQYMGKQLMEKWKVAIKTQ
jgi:thiamine biosynthesis lipoprotein ApbE